MSFGVRSCVLSRKMQFIPFLWQQNPWRTDPTGPSWVSQKSFTTSRFQLSLVALCLQAECFLLVLHIFFLYRYKKLQDRPIKIWYHTTWSVLQIHPPPVSGNGQRHSGHSISNSILSRKVHILVLTWNSLEWVGLILSSASSFDVSYGRLLNRTTPLFGVFGWW